MELGPGDRGVPAFQQNEFVYTACFCEENIWYLAKKMIASAEQNKLTKPFVAFVSNHSQTVAIWHQRSGDASNLGMVCWDYHVIFICELDGQPLVFDLDTDLPFPSRLDEYCRAAFPQQQTLPRRLRPMFRVVPASLYLAEFASDRSHMRRAGNWLSPPPTYPCISTTTCTMNLNEYMDMDPDLGPGLVCDLSKFICGAFTQ